MDDFEVCSNGGVETPVQSDQNQRSTSSEAISTATNAIQAGGASASAEQAPSETEAGTSGHDDSYGTDDDQFSDVGDAPDTEVTDTMLQQQLATHHDTECCLLLLLHLL